MPTGISLDSEKYINTIRFRDDQAIFHNREHDIQRAIIKLQLLCKNYNTKISLAKTKTIGKNGGPWGKNLLELKLR